MPRAFKTSPGNTFQKSLKRSTSTLFHFTSSVLASNGRLAKLRIMVKRESDVVCNKRNKMKIVLEKHFCSHRKCTLYFIQRNSSKCNFLLFVTSEELGTLTFLEYKTDLFALTLW